MNTHISYETAKALKSFCPELPEPMEGNPKAYYGKDLLCYAHDEKDTSAHKYTFDGFAYQLHDLLSKPFCEALADKLPQFKKSMGWGVHYELSEEYFNGGLPAVEACLMKMIGGKITWRRCVSI